MPKNGNNQTLLQLQPLQLAQKQDSTSTNFVLVVGAINHEEITAQNFPCTDQWNQEQALSAGSIPNQYRILLVEGRGLARRLEPLVIEGNRIMKSFTNTADIIRFLRHYFNLDQQQGHLSPTFDEPVIKRRKRSTPSPGSNTAPSSKNWRQWEKQAPVAKDLARQLEIKRSLAKRKKMGL